LLAFPLAKRGERGDLKPWKIPLNSPLPKGDFWTKGKTDVEKKELRKTNKIRLRAIVKINPLKE